MLIVGADRLGQTRRRHILGHVCKDSYRLHGSAEAWTKYPVYTHIEFLSQAIIFLPEEVTALAVALCIFSLTDIYHAVDRHDIDYVHYLR